MFGNCFLEHFLFFGIKNIENMFNDQKLFFVFYFHEHKIGCFLKTSFSYFMLFLRIVLKNNYINI